MLGFGLWVELCWCMDQYMLGFWTLGGVVLVYVPVYAGFCTLGGVVLVHGPVYAGFWTRWSCAGA